MNSLIFPIELELTSMFEVHAQTIEKLGGILAGS